MNPFLIILILIGAILLWFALSFSYKPVGRMFKKLFKKSIDAMEEEDIE